MLYIRETLLIVKAGLGPVLITVLVLGTVLAFTKTPVAVPFSYTLF